MSLDLRRREGSLFASASLTAHLARGALAALLLTWAVIAEAAHPWASLAAGVVALVALRGCPMCWTGGLVETIAARSKCVRMSIRSTRGFPNHPYRLFPRGKRIVI